MDRELEQLVWQRTAGHCEYCRLLANDELGSARFRFAFDPIAMPLGRRRR